MLARKKNLVIESGATFRMRILVRDARKRHANLNGYSAQMQIRESVSSNSVLLEMTQSNGRITIYPNGEIELLISDEDTAVITWASGVYDLILTAPNGDVIRLIEGRVTAVPGVTKK